MGKRKGLRGFFEFVNKFFSKKKKTGASNENLADRHNDDETASPSKNKEKKKVTPEVNLDDIAPTCTLESINVLKSRINIRPKKGNTNKRTSALTISPDVDRMKENDLNVSLDSLSEEELVEDKKEEKEAIKSPPPKAAILPPLKTNSDNKKIINSEKNDKNGDVSIKSDEKSNQSDEKSNRNVNNSEKKVDQIDNETTKITTLPKPAQNSNTDTKTATTSIENNKTPATATTNDNGDTEASTKGERTKDDDKNDKTKAERGANGGKKVDHNDKADGKLSGKPGSDANDDDFVIISENDLKNDDAIADDDKSKDDDDDEDEEENLNDDEDDNDVIQVNRDIKTVLYEMPAEKFSDSGATNSEVGRPTKEERAERSEARSPATKTSAPSSPPNKNKQPATSTSSNKTKLTATFSTTSSSEDVFKTETHTEHDDKANKNEDDDYQQLNKPGASLSSGSINKIPRPMPRTMMKQLDNHKLSADELITNENNGENEEDGEKSNRINSTTSNDYLKLNKNSESTSLGSLSSSSLSPQSEFSLGKFSPDVKLNEKDKENKPTTTAKSPTTSTTTPMTKPKTKLSTSSLSSNGSSVNSSNSGVHKDDSRSNNDSNNNKEADFGGSSSSIGKLQKNLCIKSNSSSSSPATSKTSAPLTATSPNVSSTTSRDISLTSPSSSSLELGSGKKLLPVAMPRASSSSLSSSSPSSSTATTTTATTKSSSFSVNASTKTFVEKDNDAAIINDSKKVFVKNDNDPKYTSTASSTTTATASTTTATSKITTGAAATKDAVDNENDDADVTPTADDNEVQLKPLSIITQNGDHKPGDVTAANVINHPRHEEQTKLLAKSTSNGETEDKTKTKPVEKSQPVGKFMLKPADGASLMFKNNDATETIAKINAENVEKPTEKRVINSANMVAKKLAPPPTRKPMKQDPNIKHQENNLNNNTETESSGKPETPILKQISEPDTKTAEAFKRKPLASETETKPVKAPPTLAKPKQKK